MIRLAEKPEKIVFYTDTDEVEFYVIEQTRINDVNYILVADSMDDEAEALILKETVNEEDAEDVIYSEIEDDSELKAISRVFSEILGILILGVNGQILVNGQITIGFFKRIVFVVSIYHPLCRISEV